MDFRKLANFSLVTAIVLPPISIWSLAVFLGPDVISGYFPAFALLVCLAGSGLGLVMGAWSALRCRETRWIGLTGAILHFLYLSGFLSFQIFYWNSSLAP